LGLNSEADTTFTLPELRLIPHDWKVSRLRDVAGINELTLRNDFPFRTIEYIDIDSVEEGIIKNKKEMEVNKAPTRARRLLRSGDIIISTVRPNLKHYARIKVIKRNSVCSTGFLVVTPKTIDSAFLYYFLTLQSYTDFLSAIAAGQTSAYPSFNPNVVENTNVPFPPISEQQAIAKTLSDLDEKIELNNQMNKTLENIAQAIFKRWFIDFEFPNENGDPYKSSGGEMVESDLGMIPRGWEISTLGDYGEFKNGINYLRTESGDAEFFIVNVRNIVNNKLILKNSLDKIKIDLNKAKSYFLMDKDILIARSASPGEVSLVLGNLQNIIYSGFSIRYRLKRPDGYLYMFLVMKKLKEQLSSFSVGTTLQSINQETLKKMKFILPSIEVLKRFNFMASYILEKTYINLIENYSLSQIRDLLLPKLMTGKIRVPLED